MASSRGSTPEMAKKQVCMMVLMRSPMPVAWATAYASMVKSLTFFSTIASCTSRGRVSHTWSAGYGLLSSKVAPGAADSSTSYLSRNDLVVQATKLAFLMR